MNLAGKARIAAAAAAALVFASPSQAQRPPACERDLKAVDESFAETLKRLEGARNAEQAAKCTVWRQHMATMERGVAVFERCLTGQARRENVGQLQDSLEDFRELVAAKCPQP